MKYELVNPPRKVIGSDPGYSEFRKEGFLIMIVKDSVFPYILDVGSEGFYPAVKKIEEVE